MCMVKMMTMLLRYNISEHKQCPPKYFEHKKLKMTKLFVVLQHIAFTSVGLSCNSTPNLSTSVELFFRRKQPCFLNLDNLFKYSVRLPSLYPICNPVLSLNLDLLLLHQYVCYLYLLYFSVSLPTIIPLISLLPIFVTSVTTPSSSFLYILYLLLSSSIISKVFSLSLNLFQPHYYHPSLLDLLTIFPPLPALP